MKSCLIFLYKNKSTDIYKSLDLLKYKKILYFDDTKTVDNLKFEGTEVQIIYSDKCSVGNHIKLEMIYLVKIKYISIWGSFI